MTTDVFRTFALRKKQRFLEQLQLTLNFMRGEGTEPTHLLSQLLKAQAGVRLETPYYKLQACWCVLVEGASSNAVSREDAEKHFKHEHWNANLRDRSLTLDDVPAVLQEYLQHFMFFLEGCNSKAGETSEDFLMPGPLPVPLKALEMQDSAPLEDAPEPGREVGELEDITRDIQVSVIPHPMAWLQDAEVKEMQELRRKTGMPPGAAGFLCQGESRLTEATIVAGCKV
eukprot:TRINITY_DN17047_c0_g1_i1.p1 TRINITY_DN17047_c0_g1~~TRINITY_DN17047_c0_g1_i1.p1  ORF type:complete len:245 (+),score=63.94 TRINITY_DN17047_c0_g1_i1:54-737(+)